MSTFSELLTKYVERSGISDAELARSIGVRRQTIFRWKEGIVARPRHRDDVMRCASRLRLTEAETDGFLLSAGFSPEFDTNELSGVLQAPTAAQEIDSATATATELSELDADSATIPSISPTPRRHRRQLWIGAVLVLLVVIVVGGSLLRLIREETPVAPTLVPEPTRTFYPTATPIPIVAAPGEILLLVAPFRNFTNSSGYNVAGRIRDALDDEIGRSDLTEVRVLVWPESVDHPIRANSVIAASNAAMLIWGEYDSGRVRVQLSLLTEQAERDLLLDKPDDLSTTINVDLPKEVKGLALLTLGRLYRDAGRLPEARASFQQALALEPSEDDTTSILLFYLGTVVEQGDDPDLDAAIDYYSRAVEKQPSLATIRYNRGLAFLRRYYLQADQSDLNLSIEDLDWVVDRRSRYTQAMLNLAIAHYERGEAGDMARAKSTLDRFVSLDPENYRGYYNRALVNIRADDREGWEADLGQVLELNPDHANSYNAYCWAYALEAEPELALPFCDRAIELDERGSNRDGLGIAYAQLGRFDDAVTELEAYLAWLETRPPAVYELYRGPQVEEWILALRAGTNPFEGTTLDALR